MLTNWYVISSFLLLLRQAPTVPSFHFSPTASLDAAHFRARVPILQRSPKRLALKRQLIPNRTPQIKQRLAAQNPINKLQRRLDSLVKIVQVVRARHPHDLQRKAKQVVVLEQLAGVQDSAQHVVEIYACERVDGTDVAADAAEFGVLRDHGDGVEVELHEAVVDGGVVPVFGDLLVARAVFEAAVVGFVDAEEGAQDFVGCGSGLSVCGLASLEDAGGLTQLSFRGTLSVVCEQAADEEETSITSKHAGERTVVEVRVVLDRLVPAVRRPLSQNIKREILVARNAVVQLLKAGHVHCPGVAGEVQVVASRGGVGLEPVVRVLDALRGAEQALGVVEGVVDGGRVAADGEGGVERERVAGPDGAHDGEQ